MRRLSMAGVLLVFLVALFQPVDGRSQDRELVSTLADQTGVSVTIYNDNLALIKDVRQLVLPQGTSSLAFREVSGQLRPETALMRSISHPSALTVREQNFDFDLLTPQKLLEKYVGREVTLVRTNPTTGEETMRRARVLSANNGVVLRIGEHIETGIPGRLVFPDVPDNLRDRPTLVMTVDSRTGAEQTVELSYLTGGLGWQADYVAALARDETRLDINGWVTLTNTSGTSFPNARLQLMAGDVNQVRPEEMSRYEIMMLDKAAAAAAPAMAEESLFEYHLYTLPHPTTIRENQTKQVALLQAGGVVCDKEYLLQGQEYYYQNRVPDSDSKLKVGVYLQFRNRRADNLGLPLPKGIVRVYKEDGQGHIQFVGEDRIDHTPENETVRLKLGDAFDLTAERKQTEFRKLAGFTRYDHVLESAYAIKLKNAKKEAVVVKVLESLPGDWTILSESHAHTRESAFQAAWQVPVPAKGEATLTYRVRVRY
ncbi:MAG: DUF4139 domain-containing protein [Desulfobacterales bacterium]|nr:DUF4139 domain-containing protein [Desulfobacterales bacterium]